MSIAEERSAAMKQFISDLVAGRRPPCTPELRKRYFSPSDSPQYHINFNITFEFKFTRRIQHPTTRSHVSARVAVPLDDSLAEETRHRLCHEKTRAAIVEALEEAYMPHFPYREVRFRKKLVSASSERDDLVAFAWKEAWEFGVMTNLPPRGYKDLNLDLLVTVMDPYVWVFDPSEGMVYDKNNFCYGCAVVEILHETNVCCHVCLEDFAGVQGWRFPCQHVFHGDCIEKWLTIGRECPVCQFRLK